jgi:hypothetical protein
MEFRESIQVIEARMQCLIDKLTDNYTKQYSSNDIEFDIVKGTKYYKLVQRTIRSSALGDNSGGSVHAFIDRYSGDVYKPASWKAPAKHVRYNLLDEVSFAACLENADWAGSYLYMK